MSGSRMYCQFCGATLYLGMEKCRRCGMRRESIFAKIAVEPITELICLRCEEAKHFLDGMWSKAWDNPSITGGFVDMFKLRKLREILNGETEAQ